MCRLCGNDGVVGDFDVRRRGFNESAISVHRSRCIQCAAHVHSTALHVAQQFDGATVSCHRASAFSFDCAGHQRGAGVGLNRDRAGLLAIGAEAAAGFKGDVLLRAQDDFAACIPTHLVGIDET